MAKITLTIGDQKFVVDGLATEDHVENIWQGLSIAFGAIIVELGDAIDMRRLGKSLLAAAEADDVMPGAKTFLVAFGTPLATAGEPPTKPDLRIIMGGKSGNDEA